MSGAIIDGLKQALQVNPENLPLRQSLVEMLLAAHRFAEAEEISRAGLASARGDPVLTLTLAEAFYGQGKLSEATVAAESLIKSSAPPARALLLLARCSKARDDYVAALEYYERAQAVSGETKIVDDVLEALARVRGRQRPPNEASEALVAHSEPAEIESESDSESELGHEHAGADPDGRFVIYEERPKVTFADVGGMEQVKEEIRIKIIHPLTHPELYAAYGKKAGGGILMFGPPGCGKTHLARATAGEVNARFISVSISDVLDMYIGQSERNLHDIFTSARANRPTVLFFDEVDALAASRRDMRQSAGRQVINQFLAELDGVDSSNEGVLIMAATNGPWHLDSAFRRPGRFDRILFVPPPDGEARATILQVLLRDRPAAAIDVKAVAQQCKDFSGADLAAVIDAAVEEKLRAAMKSGRADPLTTKDLIKSAKQIKPSTREWFTMARNHALYANESGLYDEILAYMGLKK